MAPGFVAVRRFIFAFVCYEIQPVHYKVFRLPLPLGIDRLLPKALARSENLNFLNKPTQHSSYLALLCELTSPYPASDPVTHFMSWFTNDVFGPIFNRDTGMGPGIA